MGDTEREKRKSARAFDNRTILKHLEQKGKSNNFNIC